MVYHNAGLHGKLCNPEKLPPRLQAPPVLARRLAEVLGAVAAEIAQRAEVHLVGDHHIAVGGTYVGTSIKQCEFSE